MSLLPTVELVLSSNFTFRKLEKPSAKSAHSLRSEAEAFYSTCSSSKEVCNSIGSHCRVWWDKARYAV